MALQNNDLFLVNQGGTSHKIKYNTLKSNINGDSGNDLQAVTDNGNTTKPGIVFNADTGTVVPEDGSIKGEDGKVIINSTNQLIVAEPLGPGKAVNITANNLSTDFSSNSRVEALSVSMRSTGHPANQPVNIISASLNADSGSSDVRCFTPSVTSAGTNSTAGAQLTGYYSNISPNRVPNGQSFNFLQEGNAPNYFNQNTYIGGTKARNTRQLWESTLTEEQKEQLTAGTLAIPADVSTPGDGSFVRQWWYNQQSAEDQALIDSGELAYPERLQAANFTDTFAIGDNTNINLNSNGLIQAGGYGFNKNWTSNNVQARGIVYSSTKKALLSTNRPNAADQDVDVFLARTDNTSYDAAGNRTAVNVGTATSFKAESPLGNAAGQYGTYKSYVGFHATDPGQTDNDADWTGDEDSYGFLGGIANRTEGTSQTYNFYAAGNAPNYFQGAVTGGGADGANANWSIAANGNATGITVTRASVLTDENAGTVETLLDIITNLRARLAALEANQIADDSTDSALLTLVANLSSRVLNLEGGNN